MYGNMFEKKKKKCSEILSRYKSEMGGDVNSIVEFIKKHFGEKTKNYNWSKILENTLAVDTHDWADTWYDKMGFTITLYLPCSSIKFIISCKVETEEIEKEIDWMSY